MDSVLSGKRDAAGDAAGVDVQATYAEDASDWSGPAAATVGWGGVSSRGVR